MNFKKHIPVERQQSYTVLYSLFDPLSRDELEAVARGREAFQAGYPEVSIFPDPFLEPLERRSGASLATLGIVCGKDPFSNKVATDLIAAIKEMWGLEIRILADGAPRSSLASSAPLLLIGGADLNRRSMEIARKYQVGLFCANFPGRGGWGVTTYAELESGFAPRYILSCDEETREPAIHAFLESVVEEGSQPVLGWVHRVSPGPQGFGKTETFDAWIAGRIHLFPALGDWIKLGRKQPYREVFQEFFQRDFSGGLPYNAVLVDAGIDALRYYQHTSDTQGLDLFREMMWGFWGYLNSDDPQVYISDLDFRLGTLCNLWNWIEPHPDITSEERACFPKLLLGAMRTINDYFRHHWKAKPAPHNHQTFCARSLILAWRYFKRWNLPDLEKWKEDADAIFAPIDPRAFKHLENANRYETFVSEHSLVWMEVTGREASPEMRQSLARFALRDWATHDNFLSYLDYGDCDPKMAPTYPFEIAPWLKPEGAEEAEVLEMELTCGEMFPFEFPHAIKSFSGLRQVSTGQPFSGRAGWMHLPLDPLLEKRYVLGGDRAKRFDKLVWRSQWSPAASYLALEGFGNKMVSHAHNETNGILRMNLAGRIWLVSNGYGKGSDLSDAGKAFHTRQMGPEEHNMLIVRAEDGSCEMPPINALADDFSDGPLQFAVTDLPGYGGLLWRRHTVHLPGAGFIVIDKVEAEARNAKRLRAELQWNVLGARTTTARGARFEQNGVTLVFDHFGTAEPLWEESRITAWRNLIANRDYPHTQSMPSHCILKIDDAFFDQNEARYILSGFWLDGSVQAPAWNARERVLSLRYAASLAPSVSERPWGRIELQPGNLEITFRSPLPS